MTDRAVFSVFEVTTKRDIEKLLKPAIKGRCRFVAEADGYFRAKDFCSEVLVNPTWADLLDVLNEQMKATRDYNHVFMEGIMKRRKKTHAGSVPEYEFILGS